MSKHVSHSVRIRHILEAVKKIQSYVSTMSEEEFYEDDPQHPLNIISAESFKKFTATTIASPCKWGSSVINGLNRSPIKSGMLVLERCGFKNWKV